MSATTPRPGPVTTTTSAPQAPTTADADGATGLMSSPSISHYLAARKGNITAALYDVATGTTSQWRPGASEDTASIVKVDIVATMLHRNQVQHRALSSKDDALATKMIEKSDNSATDALWDEVGRQEGVGAFNRLLGMSSTVLGPARLWGETKTTAADQLKLIQAIVLPNPVLDSASRDYLLRVMEHVNRGDAWGVSAGLAHGVTIALKNGWLPLDDDEEGWQVNSIGWIHGNGRSYILAVLTNGNRTEDYGIDTIEGLSGLVWAYPAA